MKTIYIITGPAGVGKSTISKLIAKKLKKSVLIEGDEIYHQVIGGYFPAWEKNNHLEIFWKISINIIKIYLDAHYDVIFNYIIDKKDFNILYKNFKNYKIIFIVLMVDKTQLLHRDEKRPLNYRMKNRCLILLKEFISYNFPEKYILNTSNLSTEETLKEIFSNNRFSVNKKQVNRKEK